MLGSLGAYDVRPIRSLTQEDPLGLAGGLNLYGFANGDPVNFSDPFGLCAAGNGEGGDGSQGEGGAAEAPDDDQGSQLECSGTSGTVTTSNSSSAGTVQTSTEYSWSVGGTPQQTIQTQTGWARSTQFTTITATNLRTGEQRTHTAMAGSDTASGQSKRMLTAGELSRERQKTDHVKDECKKRQKPPDRKAT